MKELLFPIVVNGLLGLLLWPLLRWRARPDTERLAGPAQALCVFQRFFPDATGRATVTLDGRAALVATDDGGVGLVVRDGHRWRGRMLAPRDLRGVRAGADRMLELRFTDFGWSPARLSLSEAASTEWRARLGSLTRARPAVSDVQHA
jgi:hypothetical protein